MNKVHEELLESVGGYDVRDDERTLVHVMFVDIVKSGGDRSQDRAVFQKYFTREWDVIRKVLENPVYGVKISGHNEFVVLHDPRVASESSLVRVKKKEAAPVFNDAPPSEVKSARVEPPPKKVKPASARTARAPKKAT
jgi:hypothetical protein